MKQYIKEKKAELIREQLEQEEAKRSQLMMIHIEEASAQGNEDLEPIDYSKIIKASTESDNILTPVRQG